MIIKEDFLNKKIGFIKMSSDKTQQSKDVVLYGFGRTWSLFEMGTGGWFFNEILAGEAAREWICLSENEELPKTSNSEQDVVQSVTRLVKRGEVKNTQQGIKDAIKSNLPFRKRESRDRITAKIMQNCDTPQKYIYYIHLILIQMDTYHLHN